MKKHVCMILSATAILVASIGTASASAATEFGSGCLGGYHYGGGQISVGHSVIDPLPAAAPVAGVLTEWKVNVGTIVDNGETPLNLNQELYVVRSAGPDQYLAVGKSESATVLQDRVNSFGARIPVQVGDLLALDGPATLYCLTPEATDQTVDFGGSPYIGTVFQVTKPFEGFQTPVIAKIEPDVDGDGYGDETQDKCPQSPLFQEACPTVIVRSQPSVGARAVNVSVTTSVPAPVSVSAKVALGKGRTATLKAPAQTVAPGDLATFNLTLRPRVIQTLERLAKSKSLSVTVTATAPNSTGAPSQSVSVVKLRGHSTGARA